MAEWILIITMQIYAENKSTQDVQFDTVSGFRTESACTAAGGIISTALMKHVKQHKRKNTQSLVTTCKKIPK